MYDDYTRDYATVFRAFTKRRIGVEHVYVRDYCSADNSIQASLARNLNSWHAIFENLLSFISGTKMSFKV